MMALITRGQNDAVGQGIVSDVVSLSEFGDLIAATDYGSPDTSSQVAGKDTFDANSFASLSIQRQPTKQVNEGADNGKSSSSRRRKVFLLPRCALHDSSLGLLLRKWGGSPEDVISTLRDVASIWSKLRWSNTAVDEYGEHSTMRSEVSLIWRSCLRLLEVSSRMPSPDDISRSTVESLLRNQAETCGLKLLGHGLSLFVDLRSLGKCAIKAIREAAQEDVPHTHWRLFVVLCEEYRSKQELLNLLYELMDEIFEIHLYSDVPDKDSGLMLLFFFFEQAAADWDKCALKRWAVHCLLSWAITR